MKHVLDFDRAILTFVTGIACVAAAAGCAGHGASPKPSPSPALSVTVAKARRGDLAERVALTGIVNAKAQANLQSVITGQVVEVDALVGDRVNQGEVLVRIDDSTVRAQLQQNIGSLNAARAHLMQVQTGDVGAASSATANLDSAQVAYQTALSNYNRNKQLLAQGYVSQSAVDQAAQAAAAAQAQLRGAQVAAQNANLGGRTTSSAQAEIHNAQAAVDEAQAPSNSRKRSSRRRSSAPHSTACSPSAASIRARLPPRGRRSSKCPNSIRSTSTSTFRKRTFLISTAEPPSLSTSARCRDAYGTLAWMRSTQRPRRALCHTSPASSCPILGFPSKPAWSRMQVSSSHSARTSSSWRGQRWLKAKAATRSTYSRKIRGALATGSPKP